MGHYAEWAPTRAALVRFYARRALWWPLRPLWRAARAMNWRAWRSRVRRRVFGAPTPPPEADYRGWRVTWLSPDSMWCRTPGDRPDIEISQGCQGTVTEYVRPGTPGSHGYRIAFDNGAVFGTYLPAPWVIRLERPTVGAS